MGPADLVPRERVRLHADEVYDQAELRAWVCGRASPHWDRVCPETGQAPGGHRAHNGLAGRVPAADLGL